MDMISGVIVQTLHDRYFLAGLGVAGLATGFLAGIGAVAVNAGNL
jgi:hypothetical protein